MRSDLSGPATHNVLFPIDARNAPRTLPDPSCGRLLVSIPVQSPPSPCAKLSRRSSCWRSRPEQHLFHATDTLRIVRGGWSVCRESLHHSVNKKLEFHAHLMFQSAMRLHPNQPPPGVPGSIAPTLSQRT